VRELIVIPLESDRFAVEVLAALRRLQAEYQEDSGGAGGPGPSATGDDHPAVSRPGRRRVWWCLRSAALAALVGGAIGGLAGAATAVRGEAPSPSTPSIGGVLGALLGRGVGGGGLLVAAAGATFAILLLRVHRGEPARTRAAPTVIRLVAYLTRDGTSLEVRRARASGLPITPPEGVEGRPEAFWARADATAAR
jgi:hypothetical protein